MSLQGWVKWYNPKSGYGFIKLADASEVFVHGMDIIGHPLMANDQVQLNVDTDWRKSQRMARNVTGGTGAGPGFQSYYEKGLAEKGKGKDGKGKGKGKKGKFGKRDLSPGRREAIESREGDPSRDEEYKRTPIDFYERNFYVPKEFHNTTKEQYEQSYKMLDRTERIMLERTRAIAAGKNFTQDDVSKINKEYNYSNNSKPSRDHSKDRRERSRDRSRSRKRRRDNFDEEANNNYG